MTIDRNEVGAHVIGTNVRFGVYLPGVRAVDGFSVDVRIVHQDDQFVPEIPSIPVVLAFDTTHPLRLWSGTVDLATLAARPGSHLGQNGTYLYRFGLRKNGQVITKVFLDPFAIENGPGYCGQRLAECPAVKRLAQ